MASSTFGFKLWRQGQRSYPTWRRPYQTNREASYLVAHHHYQRFGPKYACNLLPRHNYICGDYTGAFFLHNHTYYTLQMATSGVTVRTRRMPSFYEFTHPSRWMIGKQLRTQAPTVIKMADEATISKRIRLNWVKKGWLPG